MTTVEVLTKAKELIADKSRWCQGTNSRRADGIACSAVDPAAALWDCHGAMSQVNSGLALEAWPFMYRAAHELFSQSTVYVNDTLGYDSVMKCFDRAIELAQEAGDGKATD